MAEPEQCIICLDPLPVSSTLDGGESGDATSSSAAAVGAVDAALEDTAHLNIIASLDGCEHIIHDACIRSWAQKTNTCPICRNPFHSVRVFNGIDGMSLLQNIYFEFPIRAVSAEMDNSTRCVQVANYHLSA